MQYSRQNPSPAYVESVRLGAEFHRTHKTFTGKHVWQSYAILRHLIAATDAHSIFDYGSGKNHHLQAKDLRLLTTKDDDVKHVYPSWQEALGVDEYATYDPCVPGNDILPVGKKFDGVISADTLNYCPQTDLPWIIDEMFSYANSFVYSVFALYPGKKVLSDGSQAHRTIGTLESWLNLWIDTAKNYPKVRWDIRIEVSVPPISHRRFWGMGDYWKEGEKWWKVWKPSQLKELTKKQREELEMMAQNEKQPIDPRAFPQKKSS